MGLDFSENITLPVNKEPQSLHWAGCKEQKTGITKVGGTKTYHPYLSDDLTHDQAFVKTVIEEMRDSLDVQGCDTVIISSDNCTSQYKSSQHFHDLQATSSKFHIKIIRIYGIAGHGKNEIDTVGGVVKIALRKAVAHGEFFPSASACIDFLNDKFGGNESPEYTIKEIFPERLDRERKSMGVALFLRMWIFNPSPNLQTEGV